MPKQLSIIQSWRKFNQNWHAMHDAKRKFIRTENSVKSATWQGLRGVLFAALKRDE